MCPEYIALIGEEHIHFWINGIQYNYSNSWKDNRVKIYIIVTLMGSNVRYSVYYSNANN